MKIEHVEIADLDCKHYETVVYTRVNGRAFRVSICGDGSRPSEREVARGWEYDYGMDHVESEEHLFLAKKIMEALSNGKARSNILKL